MDERSDKAMDSPYDFVNYLTIGGADLVNGAVNPEDDFSKEHWMSSIGLASLVGGARVGIVGKSDVKAEGILKYKGERTTFDVENVNTSNIDVLSKQLENIKTKDEKVGYLMEKSKNTDVSTEKNKAIFYAGRVEAFDNKIGQMKYTSARELAERYADNLFMEKEVTKLTLERTPGGKWMDNLRLYEQLPNGKYRYEEYGLTLEQTNEIWSNLSSRYAEGASGAVTAFTKNVPDFIKPKTIFWSTELPQLRNNKKVKHINIR
ncbi:hypothetical protein JI666_13805 [Bacillus sp. NTK071]|uniref:hypothetical protein n=1 Tax=Bacillus sp. NTK071 TaxID=2802175 RepID=UPI001A8CFEA6|nr:hypothetical protein [Bacillus sp. NTK071]MBN8209827.1 hypothetical protein [Bacillus sp. NTK071]